MGNLGLCDCSYKAEAADDEDEEEDGEPEPPITTFKLHTRTISAFQFAPGDTNSLFSASYDSSIRKLDLVKGVAVEAYAPKDAADDDPVSGVEISRSNPNIVHFSTLEGRFGMHDMRTPPANMSGTDLLQLSEKKIGGFSLHPAHPHILATASLDRMLKIWDLRKITGKDEWRMAALVGEHTSPLSVSHAAFNGAGQVATASYDDTIKIHDFSAAGTWKIGGSLPDAQMQPTTIIPHNNQTGRWVTMCVYFSKLNKTIDR
jgi:WD repeat-containing protein 76